jgi:hypothetical protein
MASSVLAAPEPAEHLCVNPWYLWAVERDYANWVNSLSPEQRARHFNVAEYIPRAALRCPTCGAVAWERRQEGGPTTGECTEATCRETWTW